MKKVILECPNCGTEKFREIKNIGANYYFNCFDCDRIIKIEITTSEIMAKDSLGNFQL